MGLYKHPGLIFVFGSNEAGIHGAGAAKHAVEFWDAERGVGRGPTGRSYAIPTKDRNLKTLPLHVVKHNIRQFLEYAKYKDDLTFLLTPVGCGHAGFKRRQIAGILKQYGLSSNIVLSSTWIV